MNMSIEFDIDWFTFLPHGRMWTKVMEEDGQTEVIVCVR